MFRPTVTSSATKSMTGVIAMLFSTAWCFFRLMWESHGRPLQGERAQAILNRQIIAEADLVIALFSARLGTPTVATESGSAEEIQFCLERGKPVAVYFSTEGVSTDAIDPEQLKSCQSTREVYKKER
jgi:nucleoside 2-deoxyribosyltransferase